MRCPAGHSNWRPVRDHYECQTCGLEFDDLVDAKEFVSDSEAFFNGD